MSILAKAENKVVEILFDYFSNIVFLDDKFNVYTNNELINSDNFMDDTDPTMLLGKDSSDEVAITTEKMLALPNTFEMIYSLIHYCTYNKLNLFPYIYDEYFKRDEFLTFVKRFSLLILDWELDSNDENLALKLINDYSANKKLQYVIVYTHRTDIDNISDTIKKYFKEVSENFNIISEPDNIYSNNYTFISVMGKKEFDLRDAILEFSKLLIDKYGSLFVGFYDIINQAHERTGEVLKDFMHPFEVLLSLQIRCNDNSDNYFNRKLTDIINAQIMSRVIVNDNIGKCINEKILEEVKKAKTIDNQTAQEIKKSVSNSEGFTDYKKCMDKLCDKFKNKELLWESVVTHMANNNNIFFFLNTDDSNTALYEFLKGYDIELNKKEKDQKVLGMLLLLLAFKNITDKKSICKMIELIKFIRYDNEFEELIDITIDNINNPDFNSIIMNKYYCGDILINESSDDEFLLCITPPCDLFRPDKSNYCLKFLRGKKSEPSKLTKSLKVYEHATIIPINEKPTVIIWSFNNEKIFCLKNIEDLNELKKYLRPFRMKEDYIKQIISKYSSFCMRMGVDELFLKENPIGKGFLSILNK